MADITLKQATEGVCVKDIASFGLKNAAESALGFARSAHEVLFLWLENMPCSEEGERSARLVNAVLTLIEASVSELEEELYGK
ncbi:MAG: hypothetical protein ACTIOQ_04235 [Serratia grimesii]|uniref:hypothetical protein n=1 Tax=Serratia grimesii TaxID=82995 RepID=UPI003F9AA8B9